MASNVLGTDAGRVIKADTDKMMSSAFRAIAVWIVRRTVSDGYADRGLAVRTVTTQNTFKRRRSLRRWFVFAASLRGQLWLLWLFIVLLSSFMTVILIGLYQSGSAVQLDAGRRITRSTCESIRSLYS